MPIVALIQCTLVELGALMRPYLAAALVGAVLGLASTPRGPKLRRNPAPVELFKSLLRGRCGDILCRYTNVQKILGNTK